MNTNYMSRPFIYFCFFLSGAAGLMYEIIWTRFFGLTFGATTYSITTVLTAFMAGLALGSLLLGRIADRLKQRVMFYGLIELFIGIYAVLFPWIFDLSSRLYLHIIGTAVTDPAEKLFLKFGLSFISMLIPTTLMGGSLPLLSRVFVKDLKGISSGLGTLYAVNTLGAVVGTFLVGFYFLAAIGLKATLLVTALLNIGIGTAMIIASIKLKEKENSAGPPPSLSKASLTKQEKQVMTFAVSAFMISGFVSLP